MLSGTPGASALPGNYPITVKVQDVNGCSATMGYTFVLNCPTISLAPAVLAVPTQYTAYSATVTAGGGSAPYAWSVQSGTLPTGLALNSSTGVISGTPTAIQSSTFTLRATDVNGCVGTQTYTLAVSCPVITISPPSPLAPITEYTAMTNVTFSAAGGTSPYTWSIDAATPLPAGLTFNAATATLGGSATAAPGTYVFNVNAVDASGCPASKGYSITINCPAVTITNASPLPAGTVGTAYSQTLVAVLAGTNVPAQT